MGVRDVDRVNIYELNINAGMAGVSAYTFKQPHTVDGQTGLIWKLTARLICMQ